MQTQIEAAPDEQHAAVEIPQDLIDAIREGRCVAFVGAGFSAAAELPSWSELLRRVADEPGVDADVRGYALGALKTGTAARNEEVAQVLYTSLGKERFVQALEKHLTNQRITEEMRTRLDLLGGIPFRFVLTTNFDDVLAGEVATERSAYARLLHPSPNGGLEELSIPGYPRTDPSTEGRNTLKLHGDLTQPDSVVFSRLDYRKRLYTDPAYLSFLRSVFLQNTVLFLGFSFTDAYLNEVRSEVLAILESTVQERPIAYAVMDDVPGVAKRHLREAEGIEVLSYDTKGQKDFTGFDRYLEAIHQATSPVVQFGRLLHEKRILWLEPNPESVETATRGFFQEAASVAGFDAHEPEFVSTYHQALVALGSAKYDLVITHWGHQLGESPDRSAAESLLHGMRGKELFAPVIVFSEKNEFADRNKRAALRLGAQGYFYSWNGLYRGIQHVLEDGRETG